MEELPLALLDLTPDPERGVVRQWWAGLSATDRRELAELCDERWEACFFGPTADDPPAVCGGRFLADNDAWQFAAWETDWREYLVGNPDLVIAAQFQACCFLTSGGQVCLWVDWSRTQFATAELPPSEQRHAEPLTGTRD